MFTKSDKKWLKENFANKDDLKGLATKNDLKALVSKVDLQKLERKVDIKFTELFDYLDKDVMENKRKLKTIEQILRIPAVS